jgi:hypothetical protein
MHGFVFSFGSAIILYGSITDVNIFIHPLDVMPAIVFSVIAFFLFVLVAYLLTRSLETAGLIVSLFVLGFFYLWLHFLMIIIATVMCLLIIRMFVKKKVGSVHAHLALNTISVAIVGYYLFGFITVIVGEPLLYVQRAVRPIDSLPKTTLSQISTPDIYYIILDAYGRSDMLQTIHGFDNSQFIEALESRGFAVASQSKSNYPRTLLSLSSSLNMQYLDVMASVMRDSNLWWPVSDVVQHSEVRRLLENQGYKTIFFANNAGYSNIRDGDFYETPLSIQLDSFNGLFFNLTNLKYLPGIHRLGIENPSYDSHRRLILYNFERLPEVAAIKGPKFIFTHIMAPHPPYVFTSEGAPIDPIYPFTLSDQMTSDIIESRTGYIEELLFINQAILETVDGILANSESPPIIIIQGDHGPGIQKQYDALKDSCLYERYSILNAYYLPGVEKNSIPMDLSPVNSFRFIFNTYFNGKLALLSDRQYFSSSAHLYEFTDVTSQTQLDDCNTNSVSTP